MSAEFRQLKREIAELKELLQVSDLMTEEETCTWLGIAKKTLQNKVFDGTLNGTYIVNRLGHRMFYKSRLIEPGNGAAEELLTNKQQSRRQTKESKVA